MFVHDQALPWECIGLMPLWNWENSFLCIKSCFITNYTLKLWSVVTSLCFAFRVFTPTLTKNWVRSWMIKGIVRSGVKSTRRGKKQHIQPLQSCKHVYLSEINKMPDWIHQWSSAVLSYTIKSSFLSSSLFPTSI